MILLPIFEGLRSFTIQVSPGTDNISFFKAKNSQLDTFFQFSLTKILLASSEMHEDV